VLFPPYEKKEIYFNDQCEITSVEMVAAGIGTNADGKRCRAILKAYQASASKSGANNLIENSLKAEYPNHGWAKCDNTFSRGLVEMCKAYESRFVNEVPQDQRKSEPAQPGQLRPINFPRLKPSPKRKFFRF
jgi:hypothetical protein